MSRRSQQLDRIEQALGRLEGIMSRAEHALDLAKPGGLSAVAADVKDAKTAAESAFVGMQTLASQATAKPGPAELAAAVKSTGEAVRQVHAMISAAVKPAPVSMPRAPDPATPMTPVAKARKP